MKTLKKICTIVLVIMLLFGVAAGIGRIVTGSWDFGGWNKGGEITQPDPDTSGNIPDNPNNSTTSGSAVVSNIENNGIEVLAAKLPRAAYALNGISTQADTAYRLTATITPSTALDKTVDWSVAWQDASSNFASGKNVTDYVTVTPTSDGALTANVVCKSAFGSKIVVSVSSRSNGLTARCTVDYGAKLVDAATLVYNGAQVGGYSSIFKMPLSDLSTETVNYFTTPVTPAVGANLLSGYCHSEYFALGYTPSYGLGTVTTSNVTYKIYAKPTTEFYNKLKAQSIARDYLDWAEVGNTNLDLLASLSKFSVTDRISETYANCYTKFTNAISSGISGEYDFEMKLVVTTDYESKDYIFRCRFNRGEVVTNVALTDGNIVF